MWICMQTCLLLFSKPSIFLVGFPGDLRIWRGLTKCNLILPAPLPFQFPKLVIPSLHLDRFCPRSLNFFVKSNFSVLIVTDSSLLQVFFLNVNLIHLHFESLSSSTLLLELRSKSELPVLSSSSQSHTLIFHFSNEPYFLPSSIAYKYIWNIYVCLYTILFILMYIYLYFGTACVYVCIYTYVLFYLYLHICILSYYFPGIVLVLGYNSKQSRQKLLPF